MDVPDISLEVLSVVFSAWRQQIETAIQSDDILTAKRLLAQFVSKIELSREKAVIHYSFPLGIPSDGGSSLSAHIKTRGSQEASRFRVTLPFHGQPDLLPCSGCAGHQESLPRTDDPIPV